LQNRFEMNPYYASTIKAIFVSSYTKKWFENCEQ